MDVRRTLGGVQSKRTSPQEGKVCAVTSVTPTQAVVRSGKQVDEVVLDIDYQIIEHFSRHLYSSPNKAIEELVANGFDAFAALVYVYLPGATTTQHVVVWDDGWSMATQDLKDLWLIASTPKDAVGRIARKGGSTRQMIGKFGIGKLASYVLGRSITHLCRRHDDFLLVDVDYADLKGSTKATPVRTPIIKLDEGEARAFLSQIFDGATPPGAMAEVFGQTTWTVAIIGQLRDEPLYERRLMWVLGNGMPLRPDFKVWVNDEEVVPKLARDAKAEWNFEVSQVQEALRSKWRTAVDRGSVAGDLKFGDASGLDPTNPDQKTPFVELPRLGRVWGTVRLFERSLLRHKAVEHGRSHGFFILVRGRLINPDEDAFLFRHPSFGTFYRTQVVLYADGLDDVLLADREGIVREAAQTHELKVLQDALYSAARQQLERWDDDQLFEEGRTSLLPAGSREYYSEPVAGLVLRRHRGDDEVAVLPKPVIKRKPLGERAHVSELASGSEGFHVNTDHPFYQTLEARLGKSKKAQEFYRFYDIFAVAERLLEGHMYDVGVEDERLAKVLRWRDGLFRELAKTYKENPDELVQDLVNTSYGGGAKFETAIASILNSMGFSARRDGGSGKKDGFVIAAIGPEAYTFTFEAKGSKHAISNDEAEVAAAAAHRESAAATHAVIVARQFAGFQRKVSPAIIQECESVGNVSIMTVDALAALYRAVLDFGYPLDSIRDVFTTLESPDDKHRRIERLESPLDDFDYRALLEDIWKLQNSEASGDYVPYRTVFQRRPEWKQAGMDRFVQRLAAIAQLAGGLIMLPEREIVYMRQSPDIVVEVIGRAMSTE